MWRYSRSFRDGAYSYLSASIGSSLAAFIAGSMTIEQIGLAVASGLTLQIESSTS
jgi:hypothetical protein